MWRQVAYGWLSRQHTQVGLEGVKPRMDRVGLDDLLQLMNLAPHAQKAGVD